MFEGSCLIQIRLVDELSQPTVSNLLHERNSSRRKVTLYLMPLSLDKGRVDTYFTLEIKWMAGKRIETYAGCFFSDLRSFPHSFPHLRGGSAHLSCLSLGVPYAIRGRLFSPVLLLSR